MCHDSLSAPQEQASANKARTHKIMSDQFIWVGVVAAPVLLMCLFIALSNLMENPFKTDSATLLMIDTRTIATEPIAKIQDVLTENTIELIDSQPSADNDSADANNVDELSSTSLAPILVGDFESSKSELPSPEALAEEGTSNSQTPGMKSDTERPQLNIDAVALADRCINIPREASAQLAFIDEARSSGNRVEAELLVAIEQCKSEPIRSYQEITGLYTQLAEEGSAQGQYALASRYPVGSDDNLSWNKLAADNGHPQAQLTLALIYLERNSIEDTTRALRWLTQAQSNGSAVAEHHLTQLENTLSPAIWRDVFGYSID